MTGAAEAVAAEAAPVKAKSGSEKGGVSTYRKLNELFFRSKSKDKNKADASGSRKSSSLLNRSFSPPPPAEVEPKMKPSIKKSPAHLIHIVGLSKSGETLGSVSIINPGSIPAGIESSINPLTGGLKCLSTGGFPMWFRRWITSSGPEWTWWMDRIRQVQEEAEEAWPWAM